ncbi:tetratricopeptide repeat-containing glycosyltransferase family 2 protein [Anaerocolumna xylanovorans]|uniref:Tetratricopeptide repeat-containing protein n=1 Tax=Anaerocolumna xylanovorans DSM 12503 TaxID=1121345 RepID=A0A1M7YC79_9FIRM|nr:glycosyltransferase family 2 protein [Anaerocolumna xylanovorans]SHO50201.1 Tetratricopeptide repeat-containing protein [Anaerocolumna xylanovorans DSM 12503]
MVTISLAMIVKNEENYIKRCLNSVYGVVDEIIIADTGSTDKTKDICSFYTDKIYDFKWIDDFSAARNYSYGLATMDYILWLDADDFLLPEDRIKLLKLKETIDPKINTVMMKYNTGLDLQGNVVFSYYRERMTKRECGFLWHEPVHEYMLTTGPVLETDLCITHGKIPGEKSSDRNLKIYEKKLRKREFLSPRGTYYYARELRDHDRFSEAARQFELFLDTDMGWIEDNISACSELAKCYLKLNQDKRALACLFRSFVYTTPRAEICCQIGYYYQEKKDYQTAAFWFEFILSLKKPVQCWGFLQHDCWSYIPLIESAVCYDRMGDYKKALKFNTKALKVKPDSLQAKQNQVYLQNKVALQRKRKTKGAP